MFKVRHLIHHGFIYHQQQSARGIGVNITQGLLANLLACRVVFLGLIHGARASLPSCHFASPTVVIFMTPPAPESDCLAWMAC